MSDNTKPELLPYWPGGWPGQQVVDLDNLGDPGMWLEDRLSAIEEAVRGNDAEIGDAAAFLAEDYLAAAAETDFPVPSSFGTDDDECRDLIEAEFRAFLLEWRRIIQTASRQ